MNGKLLILALALVGILAGCNAGMAPAGPDQNEIKARMAKLPVDQQIALIKSSPMSQAEKDAKIAELQGGKAPESTGNPTAAPGSGR